MGIFFINVPFWGWWEDEKWLHNGEFILKNEILFAYFKILKIEEQKIYEMLG